MKDLDKEIISSLDGLDEYIAGDKETGISPRVVFYSNNTNKQQGLVFTTAIVWFEEIDGEKVYGVCVKNDDLIYPEGIDSVTRAGKLIRLLRDNGYKTWAELR
jgi:hypothetical protein